MVPNLPLGGRESVAKWTRWVFVRRAGLHDEKIVRDRFTFLKGWGFHLARKAKKAGAHFGGREPSRRAEKP